MKFIDEVSILVSSGKGGNGCVGFRREKFVPRGGPDGGDGGRGGHLIFKADVNLNTLVHFRGVNKYHAPNGGDGAGGLKTGKNGEDLIIKVPVGTLIKDADTEELIADLTNNGEELLLLKGGRGGHGNHYYKSSTNQIPQYAQEGKPGEERELILELKLLADIALVGLPNGGKSTLISSVSAAKPKIADYPFTTLEPNLGVVKLGADESFVVADIPGLIEDASEGKGLGHQFLKHIQRTKALVHLIDCSMLLEPFEAYENYVTIRTELEKYDPELINKREMVCLTKIDAMTDEEISKFQASFEEQLQKKVLPISSVSGRNIDTLKRLMWDMIEKANEEK